MLWRSRILLLSLGALLAVGVAVGLTRIVGWPSSGEPSQRTSVQATRTLPTDKTTERGVALGGTSLPAAAMRCGKRIINEWYRDGRINGAYAVTCYRAALDLLKRNGRPLPVGAGVEPPATKPPAALVRRLQQIVSSVGSARISVLDRAPTASDRLPRWVLAGPTGRRVLDRPGSARLARVDKRRRVFVLSQSRDMICLAIVGARPETTTDCAARSVLVNGTAFIAQPRGDGTTRVIGVVPDSRHWVASPGGPRVPVVNNVFVLQRVPGRTIILGFARGGQEYDIGPQRPPHRSG